MKRKQNLALRDEAREDEEVRQLVAANPGPYSDDEMERFFRLIFALSRDMTRREAAS